MHFSRLFTNQNGVISPRVSIQLNGVVMSPGVSFGSGVSIGGADLSKLTNNYFEVVLQDYVYIIKGMYQY